MAIRFKYDATGVVVPQNASNRKYGQALVLQQKRFEDDQKLLAQQQQMMLNRQRQGMPQQVANRQQLGQRQGMANLNAGFGANMAPPVNPAVFRDMAGPRRLNARINNAQANANAVPVDPAAFQDMAAPDQMQEGMLAAQMQAQERANFEEARKAGEYDQATAAEIQRTYSDATKTDISDDLDAGMKAEWHAKNNAKRSELLKNRNPSPSLADQTNNGLIYFDPRVGKNVGEFEPGVGMTTIDTINKKERVDPVLKTPKPAPALPTSAGEYYALEEKKKEYNADIAAKKAEIGSELDGGKTVNGKKELTEDEIDAEAWRRVDRDYSNMLKNTGLGQAAAQPATPPPVTPPEPPTGMQNLEPSYNAEGMTGGQMQPPPLPNPQAIEDTLFPQDSAAGPSQGVQSPAMPPSQASPQPPTVDMIGEVNQTFESGSPEQKAMLRQKMKSSDNMNNLVSQAKAGNADAEKAMASLEASLSPTDIVADEIIAANKDGKGAVSRLRDLKTSGTLDDSSYTAAIVANSGKTAKQNYEIFSGTALGKYGTGSNAGSQVVRQAAALNSLWDEMGMYDSRSYVRAFQKEPTIEDVITHVAMKGNMPRKDAEEYVYNEILSRGYSKEVQQDFEGSLTKGRSKDREKKQDAKRDAWKPKTK